MYENMAKFAAYLTAMVWTPYWCCVGDGGRRWQNIAVIRKVSPDVVSLATMLPPYRRLLPRRQTRV